MSPFFLRGLLLALVLIGCHSKAPRNPEAPVQAPPTKPMPLSMVSGTVRSGDTLEKILFKADPQRSDIQEIIAAFAGAYNVRKIQPGRTFEFALDSAQTIQEFAYHASQELTIRVARDSTDGFVAEKREIPLQTEVFSLSGTIETSLYEAVLALGETPELIIAFSDIFQWDIDFFTDPRRGDTFQLVYEKIKTAGADSQFIRYGRILAGNYTQKDGSYTAFYYENQSGKGGYYDTEGRSFQKTFLKSPLNYTRISSHFTGARRHPILKIVRPHYAVDFAAPIGTPVSAAGDGVIIEKGYNKGLGKYLKIRHTNKRYVTRYGHLNGFAPGIEKGAVVQQKQVIGYVGKTGLATGPHLDYAFYDNGRPINPLKIKSSSGDPIAPEERGAFEQVKLLSLAQLHRAALAVAYADVFTPLETAADTSLIGDAVAPLPAL